jgi:cullin-associated NEDD8-dissociated protein 1
MIKRSKQQEKYMFLSTLREIITNKPECLKPYLNILMPLYIEQSSNEDEPIRNIVSESMGKLYAAHPDIAKDLQGALGSKSKLTVATVAKSFQFSAHSSSNPMLFRDFCAVLINIISRKCEKDDIEVHKNCLTSLSNIVANNSLKSLMNEEIQGAKVYLTAANAALTKTTIEPKFVETVDLGPFKHTTDHGAPLRRAAFTLL